MKRQFKPLLETLETRTTPAVLSEPVKITSVDGVLDIVLRAHESNQIIEVRQPNSPELAGVPTLVHDFLTYSWTIRTGSANNGATSGDTYPSPTLQVQRGDTIRILLENDLRGLTLNGSTTTEAPTNLHFHGLEVSPQGNSDNVLLRLPPGMSNQYEVNIPMNHNEGVFWYHPHAHEFAAEQVYRGLAGMFVIGAANNNVVQVENLPVRLMTMQMQNIEEVGGVPSLTKFNPTNSTGYQYTINGLYNPEIPMAADNEVWVFLNAGPMDLIRTFIPPPGQPASKWDFLGDKNPDRPGDPANQDIFFLGQDGWSFPITVEQERNAHAPGKRVSTIISAPSGLETRTLVAASITPSFSVSGGVINYHYFGTILGHGTGGDPNQWLNLPLESSSDPFVSIIDKVPDVVRTVVFQTNQSTTPWVFTINGQVFPGPAVFQPRVGDNEEWIITNKDTVVHPIHIHLNDFQVIDPLTTEITPHNYNQDTFYVDAFNPLKPAFEQHTSHLKIQFAPYLGTAVMHCHNLPHEDNGMMMLIKVIPAEEIVATSLVLDGKTIVRIVDRRDNSLIREFEPFPGFDGGANVAVGDVDGDAIPDVAVAAMAGGGPRVRIFGGKSGFIDELFNGFVFEAGFKGGVSVTLGDLDGDTVDDLIVAAGPGGGPRVRVIRVKDHADLANFYAYSPSFLGGVSVAAGLVDVSGRVSVVTGAGVGGSPHVKVFRDDLFKPFDNTIEPMDHRRAMPGSLQMSVVSSFYGLDPAFRGGITVSVGSVAAQAGGTSRIIVAAGPGGGPVVSIWDATSTMVQRDAHHPHDMGNSVSFFNIGSFYAYDPAYKGGVRAGATATPNGDLLLTMQMSGSKRTNRIINLIPDPTNTRLIQGANSVVVLDADPNGQGDIAGYN